MKRIGILGTGIVAKELAKGFLKHGHEVTIGTRDPSKPVEWITSEMADIRLGNFGEAAHFGEILVLAVKGSAANNALRLAGKGNLNNKTVIDATNPISDNAPDNGVIRFFTSLDESLMEQLQDAFPEINFVKAFNSIGSVYMVDPPFERKPTMFICGNDTSAKEEVSLILDRFGWEVSDMGGVEAARAIEPLCMLWCIPGLRENSWGHAFKLLKL